MSQDTLESVGRLLKAHEVVERTGLTRAFLYELARRGQIPHVRFGRHLRFPEAAITAHILNGGVKDER